MRIGVLAVQGAFVEHEIMLNNMGVETLELRKKRDLSRDFDGLILPGGESTVQGKLIKEQDMFDELRERILSGMPVLGTCAGLILLASHISNDEKKHFATLPVTVKRNAYGRQLGSFFTREEFKGLGKVPMKFIRAPVIETVGDGVDILAKVEGKIVAVRYRNQIGLSFHPELCDDVRIHKLLLDTVSKKENA
ncbi:pyridoxal 5'-phosphate synthase glutaminase subunit PdxT [Acetivibrio clariflavus]|uniref:pyridoxal 5'-phosphate synthase glutaminase subunit PdxT n=1 Tax=Acetivibrio clariflavus TaxID=288965 RepID=UPI00048855EC|nr:pyridoxal 5'-phosphate synthase glutaminase subunit PdxT [Acetivibrio clariflavus]